MAVAQLMLFIGWLVVLAGTVALVGLTLFELYALARGERALQRAGRYSRMPDAGAFPASVGGRVTGSA